MKPFTVHSTSLECPCDVRHVRPGDFEGFRGSSCPKKCWTWFYGRQEGEKKKWHSNWTESKCQSKCDRMNIRNQEQVKQDMNTSSMCVSKFAKKKMKHQIGRFWFSPWFPVISSFLLVAVLFIYERKYSTWPLPFGKKASNTPSALGSPAKYLPTKQSWEKFLTNCFLDMFSLLGDILNSFSIHYTNTHTHWYTHAHARAHACIYIYIWVCVCTMYIYICVCVCARVRACA